VRYFQWIISGYLTAEGKVWLLRLPTNMHHGVWIGDCKIIPDWNPEFMGTFPGTKFIHVDYQPCASPIVSERLRSTLENVAPRAMQYLPCVFTGDGAQEKVSGYYLANILTCLDCLDRSRTEVADGDWTRTTSGAFNIRGPLTLLYEVIQDAQIFRVDGSRVQVIVREDVKNAIEQHALTGSRFLPVDVV